MIMPEQAGQMQGQAGPQMIMPQQAPQQAPVQQMPGQAPVQMMPGQQMAAGQQVMQNPQMMQNPNAANMGAMAVQQAQTPAKSKDNPTSTQATLLISELRDNVVIMKDGSFRAVVACKSINFDLMSDMEREGVEYSYQNFLNSLKFTTQILVRS